MSDTKSPYSTLLLKFFMLSVSVGQCTDALHEMQQNDENPPKELIYSANYFNLALIEFIEANATELKRDFVNMNENGEYLFSNDIIKNCPLNEKEKLADELNRWWQENYAGIDYFPRDMDG